MNPTSVLTSGKLIYWFIAGVVTTVLWDVSGWDIKVMQWLGSAQGFPLRDSWWLDTFFHDWARNLGLVIYFALIAAIPWPWRQMRELSRAERLEVVTGIALCLLAVIVLKKFSLTSCPWSLQVFGGTAQYVSHWAWGVPDGGPGRCFPGGHVSTAFGFLPLAMVWHVKAPQRMVKLLIAIVCLGLLLGAVQTLRGAHYPSHTAWTAIVCAMAAVLNQIGFHQWQTHRAIKQ